MTIQYVIGEDESAEMMRSYWWLIRRTGLITWCVIIGGCILLAALTADKLVASMVITIAILIAWYFFNSRSESIRRSRRLRKLEKGTPHVLTLTDDEFTYSTALYEMKVPWTSFRRINQIPGYWILKTSYDGLFILPLAKLTPSFRAILEERIERRIEERMCPTCGYNLRGATQRRCPECGSDF